MRIYIPKLGPAHYTYFLPIMLSSIAQIFDLLCSILCSCKRFVLKNLSVLLEYIHLRVYHKNFNAVTVLLENI